jgi:glycine betaine/proline transport system substrate-binding protein
MKHRTGIGRGVAYGAATLFFALATVVGSAASSWADAPPLGKKKIIYPQPGGGSAQVMLQVTSKMLQLIGYEVDEKKMATGLIYQALATGDVDFMSSAFLPGQHPHVNKHEAKLDFIGTSYAPVPSGLMAPGYVPFNTIEDLKKPEVQKMLKGEIHSGGAGWGVSIRANATIKAYGLDFKVVNSSGAVMGAAFKRAYDKKEPVLITGWCPHTICELYSYKFLSDTKGIWGYSQDYHVARLGFRKDFPRATVLLGRLSLDVNLMSKMLVWMEQEKISDSAAADRLLEQNPELVWYWTSGLGAKVMKPASLN